MCEYRRRLIAFVVFMTMASGSQYDSRRHDDMHGANAAKYFFISILLRHFVDMN
jgi:hypothetical protein